MALLVAQRADQERREGCRSMKVATFSVGGERRVGLVDLDRGTVAPFDIPTDEAADGVVALIRRNGARPATLSPYPLDRVTLEAPIPRAAPQHLLRRQELSRARARVLAKRLRFERRRRRRAEASDHLFQGAGDGHRRTGPTVRDRSARVDGHRLRGRARRDHRQAGPRHRAGRRLRPRLGLHDRQRRHRARPPGPLQPVAGRPSRRTRSARWGRGR